MGMSASQARYLSLVAQQSNLEYQGQQINQERSILSQQVSELYNSLLVLEVPTPPTTTEFTTVQYKGVDGTNTFTLGNIKPKGANYTVEICRKTTGHSLSAQFGNAVVSNVDAEVRGNKLTLDQYSTTNKVPTGNYNPAKDTVPKNGDPVMVEQDDVTADSFNSGEYFTFENGKFISAKEFSDGVTYYKKEAYDSSKHSSSSTNAIPIVPETKEETVGNSISETDIRNYYIIEDNGGVRAATTEDFDVVKDSEGNITGYKFKTESTQYVKKDVSSDKKFTNNEPGALTIAGELALTWAQAEAQYPSFDWGSYDTAIKNTYGENSDITKDSFYVYFTGTGKDTQPHFALQTDVNSHDHRTQVFDYSANGQYTETNVLDDCELSFDTSGRITSIAMPNIDSETGEVLSYTNINLEAVTVTDELAYKDAYAKYEYAQHEYDKAQQEINAKTKVIQEQDRNLELRLQRLDTQRQQITTELEAVKKVMDENIESTYKTFSG